VILSLERTTEQSDPAGADLNLAQEIYRVLDQKAITNCSCGDLLRLRPE
jgi:hypothetical protein